MSSGLVGKNTVCSIGYRKMSSVLVGKNMPFGGQANVVGVGE